MLAALSRRHCSRPPRGGSRRAAAARAGPLHRAACPRSSTVSALLPGTSLAVSPLPGSRDASPRTQISLLGAPARAISRRARERLAQRLAPGSAARLLAGRRRELRALAPVHRRRDRDGARQRGGVGRPRAASATASWSRDRTTYRAPPLLPRTPTAIPARSSTSPRSPELQPPRDRRTAARPRDVPGLPVRRPLRRPRRRPAR